MKKDKFKKMKLQIQTLDTVDGIENCVLLLECVKLEWPEAVNISMESTQQSKTRQGDGTLVVELDARGIQSDDGEMKHLRTGKQAEILDYHYFKSRLVGTIVTDVKAEVFVSIGIFWLVNEEKQQVENGTVAQIEHGSMKAQLVLANGKKVDLTDRVSVLSLDQLAA